MVLIHRNSVLEIRPHLLEREFFCKSPDFKATSHWLDSCLIDAASVIRQFINSPVMVLSTLRTVSHNIACGGARDSYHLKGRAIDLRCGVFQSLVNENIFRRGELFNALMATGIRGFGFSDTFIHLDSRLSGMLIGPDFGSYSLWNYDN
jgi:hypothetical protein